MLDHELMLKRVGWCDALGRVQMEHLLQEIQGTGIVFLDIETAVLEQVPKGLFDSSLILLLGLGPFVVRETFAVGEVSRPWASNDLVHCCNLGSSIFAGEDGLVEEDLRHEASERKYIRLLGVSR